MPRTSRGGWDGRGTSSSSYKILLSRLEPNPSPLRSPAASRQLSLSLSLFCIGPVLEHARSLSSPSSATPSKFWPAAPCAFRHLQLKSTASFSL
jgi:hypothetical protein